MLTSEMEEVLACLRGESWTLTYARDHYAVRLLSWICTEPVSVRDLRASPWRPLLSRPPIRRLLGSAGGSVLTPAALAAAWPARGQHYRVTLGRWGEGESWQQTTRPQPNLVLNLTLPRSHDRAFDAAYGRDRWRWFTSSHHPHDPRRSTLAWARLDLDLDRGEVLIEELQSDWIRSARRALEHQLRIAARPRPAVASREVPVAEQHRRSRYLEAFLAAHEAIWAEALMLATLRFCREVLGVEDIWLHSWQGGTKLKGIDPRYAPPRSIYTRLPRRFGFQRTQDAPQLLLAGLRVKGRKRMRKKLEGVSFQRLPALRCS